MVHITNDVVVLAITTDDLGTLHRAVSSYLSPPEGTLPPLDTPAAQDLYAHMTDILTEMGKA